MRNAIVAFGMVVGLIGLNVWSQPGRKDGFWAFLLGVGLVWWAAENGRDW